MSTLENENNIELLASTDTDNTDLNNTSHVINDDKKTIEGNSLSNRDSMKDEIHSIHNYLRNSGFGYGMNALKLFNLFYGLNKIETTYNDKHKTSGKSYKEITGLDDLYKFSNIVKETKKEEHGNSLAFIKELIKNVYLASIKDEKGKTIYPCKDMLFVNIPDDIKPEIIYTLIDRIDNLCKKEKDLNFQLSGKIYEYFIGRDQSAISELGAYFTDRHITTFIYDNVLKPTLKDENTKTIKTLIDPFAGSGGFTLGYIDYLNKKYNTTSSDNHIDWKSQLHNIHHYDANPDVIKYVKLEFYCTTGDFNSSSNVAVHNAFTYHYNKLKFDYIVTNPPYGGDKIDETDTIKLSKELKTCIEKYFKDKYKLRTVSKAVILKLSLEDTKDINKRNQYIDIIDKLNKYTADYKNKTVTLANTSNERFLNYASEYGIDKAKCKDKESVSFLMMMEMLNEGGTAVGVLKEGLFFDSKYQHLRKHLVENFNVSRIISIDASQFENTTTKTSIIMFHNTGKTDTIRFSELQVNKDDKTEFIEGTDGRFEIKSVLNRITSVEDKFICCADYSDIVAADYTFNHKKYNKVELVPGDGFKLVSYLNDSVYDKKSIHKASVAKQEGKYPFYTSSTNIKYSEYSDYKDLSIIIGTGGNGSLHLGKNFSCSTDNFVIKFNNDLLTRYKYYILKCNWNYLISLMNGSTIKHITKSIIQSLELPVPETEDQINYWVNYISEPYNKLQDYKSKLQTLEDKVKLDIQTILDNEETEEVALGELCELKDGYNFYRKQMDERQYYIENENLPLVKTNLNINDYIKIDDKYNKYIVIKNDIVIGITGTCGYVNKIKIDKGYHVHGLLKLKNIKNNKNYIYYYLKEQLIHKLDLLVYKTVIPCIKKTDIEKFNIQLPKDRTILDSLNPTFDEIDKINADLPKQEELYNSRLEELRKAAIKT